MVRLSLAAADSSRSAAREEGLTLNFNYTFSRTEDNLAARTGYDFGQDWAIGVNDQPHVLQRDGRLRHAVRRAGQTGQRQQRRARDRCGTGRFQASRSFDRDARWVSIRGARNLPNAGTCYADYNPTFTGPVRINGDYGDGDVLGTHPPSYIYRAAFQVPAAFTYGNTPRTLAHDLRNPNYFNQDLSIRRDFPMSRLKLGLGIDVFNLFNTVVFGGIQTKHHECGLRAGQLPGEYATRRTDQDKARLPTSSVTRRELLAAARAAPLALAGAPWERQAPQLSGTPPPRYTLSVNIELMFTKNVPYAERIERVAAAGIKAFSFWGSAGKDIKAMAGAAEDRSRVRQHHRQRRRPAGTRG